MSAFRSANNDWVKAESRCGFVNIERSSRQCVWWKSAAGYARPLHSPEPASWRWIVASIVRRRDVASSFRSFENFSSAWGIGLACYFWWFRKLIKGNLPRNKTVGGRGVARPSARPDDWMSWSTKRLKKSALCLVSLPSRH